MVESSSSQEQLIDYLALQSNPNKDQIISDLLRYGRRSFCNRYRNHLSADILSKVPSEEFLELMKQDICETWEMRLVAEDEPIIKQFYHKTKEEHAEQFNIVMATLAENGNPHIKPSSQILFLVFELTFPAIASDTVTANNLWIYLTTDGLQSLRNFADDLAPEELEEQLDETNKSPLYWTLSYYYTDELKELFEKHPPGIETNSLCRSAIESLTRDGWSAGLKILSGKISPRRFRPLNTAISEMIHERKSKIIAILQNDPSSPSASIASLSIASSVSLSISQRISDYFKLNDDPKRDEIIAALLINGRQALFPYEDDLIPELFSVEKNYNQGQADTPSLKLLREHVYENLKTALEQDHPALFLLIQREKEKNASQFNAIERRFAEYGTPYKKSSLVLFFVLQLLFNGITDDCEESRDVSNQLFQRVTNEGIQGTREFEQYIAREDLDDQINDEKSLLHCALRMYVGEEVKRLFSEHRIPDTRDLYDLVTNNIVRNGWITTIESQPIRNKIPQAKYSNLHTAIYRRTPRSIIVELPENPASDQAEIITSRSSLTLDNAPPSQEPLAATTTNTSEILDYTRNNIEEEVKSALDVFIASNQTLTEDQSRSKFATIWENTISNIKRTFSPDSFLNDSIEHVSQKYKNIDTTILVDDAVDKAISFLLASANSSSIAAVEMVEIWKVSLISEVINLAGNCVTETDCISSSISDSSIIGHYVSIDMQDLMIHNSSTEIDLNDTIQWKIFQEIIDEPLKESNRLRLNQLIEDICEQLLILVVSTPSVSSSDNVLYGDIIQYINRTIDQVNLELNVFHLRLSANLSFILHSNALLLMIIFHHQERKEEFSRQLEDLQRKKSSWLEYFIRKMTRDAR